MILKCKKTAGCKPIFWQFLRADIVSRIRKFTSLNNCLSHFWTFSLNCALNIKESLMQISLGNILYLKNVVLVSCVLRTGERKQKDLFL